MASDTVPAAVPGPGDPAGTTPTNSPAAQPRGLAGLLSAVDPARPTNPAAFHINPTTTGVEETAVNGASSTEFHGTNNNTTDTGKGGNGGKGGRQERSIMRAWLLAGAERWKQGGAARVKRLEMQKARHQANQVKETRTVSVNRSGGFLSGGSKGSGGSGNSGTGKSLTSKNNSGRSATGPKNSHGSHRGGTGRPGNGGSAGGSGSGGHTNRGPAGGRGKQHNTPGGSSNGSRLRKDNGGTPKNGHGKNDGHGKTDKPHSPKGATGPKGGSSGSTTGGKPGTQGPAGRTGKDGHTGSGAGTSNGKTPGKGQAPERPWKKTADTAGGAKTVDLKKKTSKTDPTKTTGPNATADKTTSPSKPAPHPTKTPGPGTNATDSTKKTPSAKRTPLQESRETGYRDGTRAAKVVAHVEAYRDGARDGYRDTKNAAGREKARLDKAHDVRKQQREKDQPVTGASSADHHPTPAPGDASTPDAAPVQVTGIDATHIHLGNGATRTHISRGEVRTLKGFERAFTTKADTMTRIADASKAFAANDAERTKAITYLMEQARAVKGGESLVADLMRLQEAATVREAKATELYRRSVRAADNTRVLLSNVETRYGGMYQAVVDSPLTKPAEAAYYRK